MPSQKILPARIFLLLSIIVSVSTVLGVILALGKIGKINLPVAPSPAIDLRCAQKVIITGKDCFMPVLGYEFDLNTERCIEKSTTICEAKVPFNSLEECQNVCEVKTETKSAVVGDDFLITLDANPTTGYSWEADFDKNYLILRSKDFVPDKVSSETVGAGGKEVFTFASLKTGEVTIAMNYGRSWESKPIETKVFKYIIKEKTAQAQNFSIVLNKTEFKKGEAVSGIFKFDKDIYINPNINIYKFNNNNWEYLGAWSFDGTQYTCCGLMPTCQENFSKNSPVKFTWDQKVAKEELPILPGDPITKVQVPGGRYKISVIYGDRPVCIDGMDTEFIIK